MVYKHKLAKVYKKIREVRNGTVYRTKYRAGYQKQKTGRGMSLTSSLNVTPYTPLLPLKRYGKLPYSETGLTVSSGAGVAGGYVYTCNGLYDPNVTGAGHQPMGFDQMMLFYEHYTVTKARLTVNFYNQDATMDACVGVLLAPDTTIETVISKLNENGMLAKKYLTKKDVSGCYASISIGVDVSKLNGKKDVKSEDDFRGDAAANPLEQSYFHLFSYNPSSPAGTTDIRFDITLEYEAIFTEPRKMIQS